MEVSMRKCVCMLLLFVSAAAAASTALCDSVSSSSTCQRGFNTFLHGLNSQCPFVIIPFSFPLIQVDGESFNRAVSSSQENEFMAVLFHASWCPFSSIFQSKFSTLSSMFPQIKHLMVEPSSALPSTFSRYGIHSLPSLLIVNQKTQTRYYGKKDLQSVVKFYKRTTGLDPVVNMVEDTSSNLERGPNVLQLGPSLKETFLREPYLVLSAVFVLSRAFLHFFPDIASHLIAMCMACIPNLNLGIFGESRQLIGRALQMVDVKRIWNKLKLCKTRDFHSGARNARVWASSLASVSLGETS